MMGILYFIYGRFIEVVEFSYGFLTKLCKGCVCLEEGTVFFYFYMGVGWVGGVFEVILESFFFYTCLVDTYLCLFFVFVVVIELL